MCGLHSLRPYQTDLFNAARQSYRDGFKYPCIVLGCGGGKSCIASEMAKQATLKGNRVLFIVHRVELVKQITDTFKWWGVDMNLCTVGMVQTITRRTAKMDEPELIITDEGHHGVSNSYRKIYDAFPNAKRITFTATPIRLSGGGLGDVNDILVSGVSTKWLIANEYLAPFDYYAPSVADLSGLHVKHGEFVTEEVVAKLNKPAIYGDVIKYYRQLSDGKQAICYCASVEHSKMMAVEFNFAGIIAAHLDGTTEDEERKKIVEDFRSGDVKIICNCEILGEGFDVPDCNTSILLRPTKSMVLYIQQSMRCLRYLPGKRAVIIDHVGNYARFGLPDADREWSLEPKAKKESTAPEISVRQCPMCYACHEPSPICPRCGYVYPIKERTIEEKKEARLEKIAGFVMNYETPNDCKTFEELRAYGKKKNFKPGWSYLEARRRGLI